MHSYLFLICVLWHNLPTQRLYFHTSAYMQRFPRKGNWLFPTCQRCSLGPAHLLIFHTTNKVDKTLLSYAKYVPTRHPSLLHSITYTNSFTVLHSWNWPWGTRTKLSGHLGHAWRNMNSNALLSMPESGIPVKEKCIFFLKLWFTNHKVLVFPRHRKPILW